MLSLVSLAHRAPPAEASHLALQTRLPDVKRLHSHLSSEGPVRSLCAPGTVIQDGGPRAECIDAEPSSMIQNAGKGAVCRDADPALGPGAMSSTAEPVL